MQTYQHFLYNSAFPLLHSSNIFCIVNHPKQEWESPVAAGAERTPEGFGEATETAARFALGQVRSETTMAPDDGEAIWTLLRLDRSCLTELFVGPLCKSVSQSQRLGDRQMVTREQIEASVRSPQFSHGRAGDRLYRGMTLIYHRDLASPSGVTLACAGDASIVDPIIREFQRTSPLSPTER